MQLKFPAISLWVVHRRNEHAVLELCQGCIIDASLLCWVHHIVKHIINDSPQLGGFTFSHFNKVRSDELSLVNFNYPIIEQWTFRTMNVSLAMMFGRLGAIIGNLLFPWLLSLGCLPAFSMIGGFALGKKLNLFKISDLRYFLFLLMYPFELLILIPFYRFYYFHLLKFAV